ncbi:MAG: hypothetical protein AB1384_06795 [Actinomycetota bacterium]
MSAMTPGRRLALRLGVAAAMLTCLALIYCGCSASTPQRAVGDFISARIAGKDDKAAKMTVEETLEGYAGGEAYLYASSVTFTMDPPQVDGDRAVVTVHYAWDDKVVDLQYVARRVGTKWKVALAETEELWLPDIDLDGGP